jgi:hypothetical protein
LVRWKYAGKRSGHASLGKILSETRDSIYGMENIMDLDITVP